MNFKMAVNIRERVRKNTEWRFDRLFGYAIINSLNVYYALVKIGSKDGNCVCGLLICTYNAITDWMNTDGSAPVK